jgi:hypothetical protein
VTRAGNPGDEDVVGVVDKVVAGKGIYELVLAAKVCSCDRHQLAVACRRRMRSSAGNEVPPIGSEQRSRDEDDRVVAGSRGVNDRGDGRGIAHDEAMDEVVGRR